MPKVDEGVTDYYVAIAPDVKLGNDVRLGKFLNLYGCCDRRRDQDRRVRRDPEERDRRPALQDLEPHVHLRRRDDRGPRVHRPRRDVHQRLVSARDDAEPASCRPQQDWKVEPTLVQDRARRSARAPRSSPTSSSANTRSSAPAASSPATCRHDAIVAGNPARVLRTLDQRDREFRMISDDVRSVDRSRSCRGRGRRRGVARSQRVRGRRRPRRRHRLRLLGPEHRPQLPRARERARSWRSATGAPRR